MSIFMRDIGILVSFFLSHPLSFPVTLEVFLSIFWNSLYTIGGVSSLGK